MSLLFLLSGPAVSTANAVWVRLDATAGPTGGMACTYDVTRQRGVRFGGWDGSTMLGYTYEWDGTSWRLASSSGPAPRYNAGLVFDSARARAVLFGGWTKPDNYFGDTWEWDGASWLRVATGGPHARANESMAYDSARGKTVLFGGSYYQTIYGDTWEWDGSSWTRVATTGPSARIFARTTYDPARRRVVLFGGQTTYSGTLLNDTWEWDGSSWTRVATTGPPGRSWQAMTYDPVQGHVVLFGGGRHSGSSPVFDDLWVWDGTSWARVDDYGPSRRVGSCLFFDPALQASLLFGGFSRGSGGSPLPDTWAWQPGYLPSQERAVRLDGYHDYIEVPDNPALEPQAVTLEAWIKVNDFKSYGGHGVQWVIFKKNSRGPNFEGYQITVGTGSHRVSAMVTSKGGTQVGVGSTTPLNIGEWYHVAVTADSSKIRLYLNGELQGERATGFPLDYGDRPLFIGRTGEGWEGMFNGWVDEVRIWNYVRTQDEIRNTMRTRLTGNEAGLVAYYDMERTGQGAGLAVDNRAAATGSALNGVTGGTQTSPLFALTDLQLCDISPPTPLYLNTNVLGHVSEPYCGNAWEFSGSPGQQVRLKVGAAGLGVSFDLTGPNGWVGFSRVRGTSDPVSIPAMGSYTLIAHGPPGTTYTFELRTISAADLPVGNLYQGQLVGDGQAQLFKLDLPAGTPLKVALSDIGAGNSARIYVKFGLPPTRGDYDYRSDGGVGSDQQISIPLAHSGTWYILIYADTVNTPSTYTLTAEAAGVFVDSVTPDHSADTTDTLLTLTGAGFDATTQVTLVGAGGELYDASEVEVDSFTQLTATFPAGSVPVGLYSVRVSEPSGDSDELADAFEMVAGGSPNFEANLIVPSRIGYHIPATIWVEYANTGDAPMRAPLLVVTAEQRDFIRAIIRVNLPPVIEPRPLTGVLDPADPLLRGFWTSAMPKGYSHTVQILATGDTPGLLQPGESKRVPVQYAGWLKPWDFSYPPITFKLGVLEADDPTPVDWASLKDEMRPKSMEGEAWDAVWDGFVAQAGSTWGDYVTMLTDNAAYLGRLGLRVVDVSDLLAFEFAQADGLNIIRNLAAPVDAYVPAPGMDIVFLRIFPNSISKRFQVGPLGRGWSHNWEFSLEVEADGTVVVHGPGGSRRIFQPDSRPGRGYLSMEGDHGELRSLGGGAFALEEPSGFKRVFRADGKLDYVEDPNGNRITAAYRGGLLTSLTHSAGQALQIGYDGGGRIISISDPVGRQTTFTYDAAGEHLLSAHYFDGSTVGYSYSTESTGPRAHALVEISFPGGTHRYFTYGADGRLSSTSKDGNAERLAFSYDTAGMVAVSDALGDTARYYLDYRGLVVKTVDPLANVSRLDYDEDYNLVRVTDPAGLSYTYEYDAQANLSGVIDPLGNVTEFAHGGPFDRMTKLTDANGNETVYSYDTAGNLTAITYADGSVESWSYDSTGTAASWTNRRGSQISYEYDADGRLTAKVYPDGSRVEYEYDGRGNLVSATDATGTTLLEYDANDRLRRITYPGNRYLEYTYNAAGQRASMTDQLGHRLDYRYDAAGRLESLTDETGLEIVHYYYDETGRLELKVLGNGVYTTYEYDAVGRLTSLVNYKPDDTVLSQFIYTYDSRGRRTSMTTLEGRWDYEYDDLGQLTGWTAPDGRHVEYEYDPLGNRVTVTDDGAVTEYTTNNMNQYTQVGDTTYTYDADGNMTQKIAPEGVTTYTYDDENRLVAVSSPDGTWVYTYDAFGNRVRVDENGVVTEFVIDPIGFGDVVGEYNAGAGAFQARVEHGLGLVACENNGGLRRFPTADPLGNIHQVVSTSGTVLQSCSYLPFGEGGATAAEETWLFRYGGEFGLVSDSNGLVFMRRRYYAPDLGRFLTPDPLRRMRTDGRYNYVVNSVTHFIDPLGLQGVDLETGLGGLAENVNWYLEWFRGWAEVNIHGKVGTYDIRNDTWTYIDPQPEPERFISVPWEEWENGVIVNAGTEVVPRLPTPCPGNSTGALDDCPVFRLPAAEEGGQRLRTQGVPLPPTEEADLTDTAVSAPKDPNIKLGPGGWSDAGYITADTLLPYRVKFENEESAAVPAQIVTVTDKLDSDLDWTTFELTEIGFGDVNIAVPPKTQHFETTVPITYNSTDFEVQIEAGIHLSTGQVYANFYSIDPATSLPPNIDVGFLPPEDGTGRGQGYFAYVVRPKPGLAPGTEIRNVAEITFDFQETIATNQVDPHDPSQGTDPAKEALNTIAPESVSVTLGSTTGGSVASPGEGTFSYGWLGDVTVTAVPDDGYAFVGWSGDVDVLEDVYATESSFKAYKDISLTANFAPLATTTVRLDEGFNLIAIPVDVSGRPDLRDWVPDLGGSDAIEKVMAYDAGAGKFVTIVPGDPASERFDLHGGEGLVVYAKKPTEITFTSKYCPAHDLAAGLNLVGFTCAPDGYSAFDLLADLGSGNVASIERFSLEDGRFEAATFDSTSQPAGVDFPIAAGEGYLVFMKNAVPAFTP